MPTSQSLVGERSLGGGGAEARRSQPSHRQRQRKASMPLSLGTPLLPWDSRGQEEELIFGSPEALQESTQHTGGEAEVFPDRELSGDA